LTASSQPLRPSKLTGWTEAGRQTYSDKSPVFGCRGIQMLVKNISPDDIFLYTIVSGQLALLLLINDDEVNQAGSV